MHGYVEQRQLGKVLGSRATMHLAHCRKFEPDILFVRKERLELLKEKELEGAVDMVVEILSEWTRDYDLREKRQVYQEAYTTKTTTSGRLESNAMQGFFVQAEWLWQEILPDPFFCL